MSVDRWRPRVARFRLGTTVAAVAVVTLAMLMLVPRSAAAKQTPVEAAPPAPTDPPAADPWRRWIETQAFTLAGRYNFIRNAAEETRQNRMQTQVQVRGRVKFDEAGRYSLHAGVFTGAAFDGGWNATGIGTGDGTAKMYLKQLFVAAEPWQGVELRYGSMAPARGQSTEITTYDNDAYVTSGRVSVRRPDDAFFDDITVSIGYVGYFDRPFVFDRGGAFSRQNYWQVLVSKELREGLTLSTDYSEIDADGMLRQGAAWQVAQPWVDTLSGEYGVRLRGGSHETAFAVSGEKQVGAVKVLLGYANVDPVFGLLNGDPYGRGNRVYTIGSFPLPLDLSASWFVQKEISPPITSNNDIRVDLAVTWNVLTTLKRAAGRPR